MVLTQATGIFQRPSSTIQRRITDFRENYTHNNDAKYDSLVSQFNSAATINEAKKLFRETDIYALQQHWVVSSFPVANPVVWQPYLKGYTGQLLGGSFGFYAARLWIDPALQK